DAKSAKARAFALFASLREIIRRIIRGEAQSGGAIHAENPVPADGDPAAALPALPGGPHVPWPVRDERPLPGLRPRLRTRAGVLLRGVFLRLLPVDPDPRADLLLAAVAPAGLARSRHRAAHHTAVPSLRPSGVPVFPGPVGLFRPRGLAQRA